MKQGIVIQGPTDFYKEMADHYSKYDKVVWATWNDESALRLDYIKSKGIEVVLVEKPEVLGYMNVNMQVKSTFAGLEYLQEANCCVPYSEKVDEVLKVRSDTIITNLDKLLPKLKGNYMSFMATCKTGVRKDLAYDLVYYHDSHDYPADNVVYGKMGDMLAMFDFQIDELMPIPPEALITWNYMTSKNLTFHLSYKNMINEGITFFLKDCLDENVEVNWLKRKVNLVDWYKDKTVYEW
tara:strand:+ start:4409 stop:5122 length:714 start_codon:yes stop_codon:yes gene_type:complete